MADYHAIIARVVYSLSLVQPMRRGKQFTTRHAQHSMNDWVMTRKYQIPSL